MPDFLTPPPTTPVATIEDELEILRATPAETVRGDVRRLFRPRRPPSLLDPLLADPRRELKRMTAVLAEFWERTLEPHWPRIRALLEADLAYRARRLTERGASGLFADLHDSIAWEDDVLELRDSACEGLHALGGRGLLLVPSAFQWQRPATIVDPPWQPTLLYPARGVGLLWEQPGGLESGAQLAGVLGPTRARLLTALESPQSTTALAARIELSPGGVSQHLSALRDAGLVTGTRHGRSVLYVRTPLADRMVQTAA
jgi:DNA-binding transcriptional ArsR family regulator